MGTECLQGLAIRDCAAVNMVCTDDDSNCWGRYLKGKIVGSSGVETVSLSTPVSDNEIFVRKPADCNWEELFLDSQICFIDLHICPCVLTTDIF